MPEAAAQRRCDRCYFCRDLAGTLHCVHDPPALDPETGEARWPCVHPDDICGSFRLADGNPLESDRWPRNDLPIYTDQFGDYCKIPLTKGQFAKVDPQDYLWLSQFRWHCKSNPDAIYAVRQIQEHGRSKRIYMHRLIMNTPDGLVCDHMNHDGLDNRQPNLRNCTIQQNNTNRRCSPTASSQYIGVAWDRDRQKWTAYIKKDGHQQNLGLYDDEVEAAKARDAVAWALHGVYANLNFPEDYPDHPAARLAGKSEARNAKSETDCSSSADHVIASAARQSPDSRRFPTENREPRTENSSSVNHRHPPPHCEPRQIRETDLKGPRRVGLAPPEVLAKRRRPPRRKRTVKGDGRDLSGAQTKARNRKGKRNPNVL